MSARSEGSPGRSRIHEVEIKLPAADLAAVRERLGASGARLVSIYSMGPILEGIGLNITVWSYCGSLNFGIVSCRELMPDLWRLTDHIQDALEELKKAMASQGRERG